MKKGKVLLLILAIVFANLSFTVGTVIASDVMLPRPAYAQLLGTTDSQQTAATLRNALPVLGPVYVERLAGPGLDYGSFSEGEIQGSVLRCQDCSRLSQERIGQLVGIPWANQDFIWYFMFGEGKPAPLDDIGLLEAVKQSSTAQIAKENFGKQVAAKINSLQVRDGMTVTDEFERVYNFKEVSFSLGDSTLKGVFTGKISRFERHGFIFYSYSGDAVINFWDEFTDPTDLVGATYGHNPPPWIENLGNGAGTKYIITGTWKWQYSGVVGVK